MGGFPSREGAINSWNTRHPEPAQAQVSDAEVEAALLSDETAVDRWRGQGIPAPEILMREALEAAARARLSAPLPDGRS